MTMIMNATEMTDGQIENAVGKLRDAMRKHRSEVTSYFAQQALGVENLGMVMFSPFCELAESLSKMVIRKVPVNRSRSPQEALIATNRALYTDREVVNAMPKGEGDEAELVFFKPNLSKRNGYISDDGLEKEFELRGLKSADPIAVAAVNEADSAFADSHPNATHWKDASGKWCYLVGDRWNDERGVGVGRNDSGWRDRWWFAGVRK